ncbi:hypothetical protein NKJ06_28155 [Mesorhizobium sp. M0293]|uniref:hypothetical protein n=1 Tax=Mesorhizobium sp. M0293 TaxID=2956930 RepID=UPI0033354832
MALRVESLAPPIKVESWLRGQPLTSFPAQERADALKTAGTILPAISGRMRLLAAFFFAIKRMILEPVPENAASSALAYVREHGRAFHFHSRLCDPKHQDGS